MNKNNTTIEEQFKGWDVVKKIYMAGAKSRMGSHVYIGKPMSGVYVARASLTDKQVWEMVKEDFKKFLDGEK